MNAPRYTKAAKKSLTAMDAHLRDHIKKAVNAIPRGDVKPLKGRDNLYRLRVGGWRIVFAIEGNTAIVLKIAPRGDVYKK